MDHIELGIEGGKGDFSVTVLPRTTDRDAVLKVDYGSTLVALRVQDGKFILNKSLSIEGNIDLNSVDLYMRNAEDAVLNTAGDALLIATPEYTTVGDANAENSYNIYQTGTLLVVYPLDGSARATAAAWTTAPTATGAGSWAKTITAGPRTTI